MFTPRSKLSRAALTDAIAALLMCHTSDMPPGRRAVRDRVRAEMTQEIVDVARRNLAADGASGLSLRSVARELGVASSAVYRYVASRDELLTRLIIEAYEALGLAVEQQEATVPRADLRGRWFAACRAVRRWALASPHEYALIYGSPVPGYRAPADTIAPAARVAQVMTGIIDDALTDRDTPAPPPAWAGPAWPPGRPDLLTRGVVAWTAVLGLVSLELFGHYAQVVDDHDAWYDAAVGLLADTLLAGVM